MKKQNKIFERELKKALRGNKDSLNYIGACYYNGRDINDEKIEQDFRSAYTFFREAEKKGSDKAKFNLGLMYKNGDYVEKSFEKFYSYMKPLAKKNDFDAINQILKYFIKYREKEGIDFNSKEIFSWFKKAAFHSQATNQCKYNLACMYLNGHGTNKSEEKFLEIVEPLVKKNHYYSIKALASYYVNGDEYGEKLKSKPVRLIKKLAHHKYADNEDFYNYGFVKICGPKKFRDYNEGFEFLVKAVLNNHSVACFEMGMILIGNDNYLDKWNASSLDISKYFPKNFRLSGLELLQNSANQNFLMAQLALYHFYIDDLHAKLKINRPNYSLAFKWCEQAALSGDKKSQHRLAKMYENGIGVLKNRRKSQYWMTQCCSDPVAFILDVKDDDKFDKSLKGNKDG